MRAYVINVETSVERLNKFMLWASMFDVIVFKAITGVTRKERQNACKESHILVLKQAIEENVFPCVIFEDDAEPCGDIDLSILDSAPSDWPLYLGALPVKNRKRCALEGTGWKIPSVKLYGCHAIAYKTKEAAEKILLFKQKYESGNADTSMIQFQRRHCVFVYLPLQFQQAEGFSDIDAKITCKR